MLGGSSSKKGKDAANGSNKGSGKKAPVKATEPVVEAGPNEKARQRKVGLFICFTTIVFFVSPGLSDVSRDRALAFRVTFCFVLNNFFYI